MTNIKMLQNKIIATYLMWKYVKIRKIDILLSITKIKVKRMQSTSYYFWSEKFNLKWIQSIF